MAANNRFSPELLDELCDQLKQGIPKKFAASYVGIHRSTIHDWEQRGKHARAKLEDGGTLTTIERKWLDASERIEMASGYGVAWLMHQILDAAGGEKKGLKRWSAYMTILERTHPQDFRRRSSSEYIAAADRSSGKSAAIDVSQLTREQRQQLRELLTKARVDER